MRFLHHCGIFSSAVSLSASMLLTAAVLAQPVVPGTGAHITEVGDDFEASFWDYNPNHPKSSRNIDEKERGPLGESANDRWLEGPHRGSPDILKRIPTPRGGLPDSRHALLIRTLNPGIPGKETNEPQQDDIMVKVRRRLGKPVPCSAKPNCVVRVFVPPFERWEQRSGASFGFRMDMWGKKPEERELTQYWPGMFLNLRRKSARGPAEDMAFLTIRGDAHGRDIRSIEITPGWWTLGLSVSPDGMCHFYARQGVEDLRAEDRLASYFCYGFDCDHLDLFFFNIVTADNGKTWSTPWIIDDPCFYCERRRELSGDIAPWSNTSIQAECSSAIREAHKVIHAETPTCRQPTASASLNVFTSSPRFTRNTLAIADATNVLKKSLGDVALLVSWPSAGTCQKKFQTSLDAGRTLSYSPAALERHEFKRQYGLDETKSMTNLHWSLISGNALTTPRTGKHVAARRL